MSERTFRAVVAAVLVIALALAVVLAGVVLLRQSSAPSPSTSVAPNAAVSPAGTAGPTGTPAPTPTRAPAFTADVIGVGPIPRGSASGRTLALRFLESGVDAIPDAAGSFLVTLTDQAGDGATLTFVGTPMVVAPGSLGASARLVGANVLQVSIRGSDPYNKELLTVRGLGIGASSRAALGAVHAEIGGFTGSLATGITPHSLASLGTVIAGS
jgi:hypothetical protein